MSNALINMIPRSVYSKLRYLLSYPQWNFDPPRVRVVRKLVKVGSEYGGYSLDLSLVNRDSTVYSLGIGEDISFDLGLIDQFGAAIHAFDPTPAVKKWIDSQSLPEQFHFHDAAIGDSDGEAVFYLPPRKDYISHSMVQASEYSKESIRVPVMRLSTAMRQLGHTRIDVLKMDIEGAEYTVLQDVIQQGIPIGQLLIEFHHRLSSIGTGQTRRILALLEGYGMKVAYTCPRMEVFTLVQAR